MDISYKVFVIDVKENAVADLAGSQVKKYQIIRKLAEGGFAEVYLGEHVFTHRTAAIKVLKGIVASGSKEDREFKNEAITIAKLEHPHIIPLFDCGLMPNSRPYITMLLCETDLAKRLRGSILSLEQVLEYAVPIAQALFHAHEHGIVHRDIKPQNVLISQTGTLLLSDFGIAVKSTTGQAPLESVVGTAPYMAPEQLSGHARRATDQYALGIMIYEWLCGKKPFVGNHDLNKVMISYGHLHNNVDIPSFASKGVTTVDPKIEQAVRRALAKKPDDRFKTVLDFVGTLEDVRTRLIRQAQEARERAQQQKAEEQRRRQQEYINKLQEQIQQEKNYSVKVEEALIREQEAKRQVEKSQQELQQQLVELKVALQNGVQQVETLIKQNADLEGQVQTLQKEKERVSKSQPCEEKQVLEKKPSTEIAEQLGFAFAKAFSAGDDGAILATSEAMDAARSRYPNLRSFTEEQRHFIAKVKGQVITFEQFKWAWELKGPYTQYRISSLRERIEELEQTAPANHNAKKELILRKSQLNELKKLSGHSERLRETALNNLVNDVLIREAIDQLTSQDPASRPWLDVEAKLSTILKKLKIHQGDKYPLLLSEDRSVIEGIMNILRIFHRYERFALYLYWKRSISLSNWLRKQRKQEKTNISINYALADIKAPGIVEKIIGKVKG